MASPARFGENMASEPSGPGAGAAMASEPSRGAGVAMASDPGRV